MINIYGNVEFYMVIIYGKIKDTNSKILIITVMLVHNNPDTADVNLK